LKSTEKERRKIIRCKKNKDKKGMRRENGKRQKCET
jgi:hypothetical protein